tara:strand:+ start:70 stop:390 length:321 start_codon:yes stop_codon:yes gene_type:complete
MNVKGLKKQLKDMGLPTNGNKSVLEFRLAGALKYEEVVEEETEEVVEEAPEEEVTEELPEEEVKIVKRPDRPSTEWNMTKHGKRPDGAFVTGAGVHILADGTRLEE